MEGPESAQPRQSDFRNAAPATVACFLLPIGRRKFGANPGGSLL